MKQIFTLLTFMISTIMTRAQSDSTQVNATGDTLRIGNIIIVRNGSTQSSSQEKKSNRNESKNYTSGKRSNVSTNWVIVDIGFNNYSDQTNYSSASSFLYNRPGAAPLGKSDFALNAGKSINVNIWAFMQKLNLVNHQLFLKYGLGVELHNFRYKSSISYLEQNPFVSGIAPAPIVFRDSVTFSKNKLAADYVSVPLMLTFQSSQSRHKGISLSVGVSAGYLYSQRNKQVSQERGKQTNGGNFDLEPFKISYVGELGLGPIRLYGSYTPKSIYQRGMDIRPYTFGIRLSNW